MILGRGIVGLGVGLASCIVPVYIGELAPTLIRGKLVTVNVVFITLGQLSAYGMVCTCAVELGADAKGSNRSLVSAFGRGMEMDGRPWCCTGYNPARISGRTSRVA